MFGNALLVPQISPIYPALSANEYPPLYIPTPLPMYLSGRSVIATNMLYYSSEF